MFDRTRNSLHELESAILEAQPTPLLAYSRTDAVVLLANGAARRLFAAPYSLVGGSVARLPIVSAASGLHLKSLLLSGEATVSQHSRAYRHQDSGPWSDESQNEYFDDNFVPSKDNDDIPSSTSQIEVRIMREAPLSSLISRMTIARLWSSDENIYMLSFERPEPVRSTRPRLPSLHLTSKEDSATSLNQLRRHHSNSWYGTKSSASDGEAHLQSRFAELRDAIYFNESSAGFLLSADETFCFPNYHGAKDATPVEIDDVDLFFAS
jgi:hypothetical protein